MMMPADFQINPSGRIDVVLGIHRVAVIEPWHGPQGGAHYFLFNDRDRSHARSVQMARRLVLQHLAQWFEAAGEMFWPIAEALARQAEEERGAENAPPLFNKKR